MVVMKSAGADEAEESRERRERKTGTVAARETATCTRERDDARQTEVCESYSLLLLLTLCSFSICL